MANSQMSKAYDVFLSFHSEDRAAVEKIAMYLADRAQLCPWFDQWELIPGEPWVQNLERGLAAAATCAVFVGKSGEGPWQKREVEAALQKQVKNSDFRVIPVLLPDAPKQPELPSFLSSNTWVKFQKSLGDDDALWRLECGIRGEAPGRGRTQQNLPIQEKNIPKYDHCLRQDFTEWIVHLLQRGKSINLIGREGIGRQRLLEDIQKTNLANTKVIRLNVKSYQASYNGLLKDIYSQLGEKGTLPQNFSEVIERCENCKEQVLILFYNFDELSNNIEIDPKYDY